MFSYFLLELIFTIVDRNRVVMTIQAVNESLEDFNNQNVYLISNSNRAMYCLIKRDFDLLEWTVSEDGPSWTWSVWVHGRAPSCSG